MKHLKTLAVVALLAATILASPTAARAQGLSINPMSWDYGAVPLGTSSTHSFTFTSDSVSAVWIYLVQLTPNETEAIVCGRDVACDFAITSSPGLPIELPPGEQVVVEVTFTPSTIGFEKVYLMVISNDTVPPLDVIDFLPLTGVGVEGGVPPIGAPVTSLAGMIGLVVLLSAVGWWALRPN